MKNSHLPSTSSRVTRHLIGEPAKSKTPKISKPTDRLRLKRDEAISDLVVKVKLFNLIYKDLTDALANPCNDLGADAELKFLRQWQELVTLMVETLSDRQIPVEKFTKGGRPQNDKARNLAIEFISEYKKKNKRFPSAAYVHSTLTNRHRIADTKNLPSQSTIRDILKGIKAISKNQVF